MKIARRMPNASFRILSSGVTAWTVEEAFDTIRCRLSSFSSLTPMTAMTSNVSSGGASEITRFAPAARCFSRSARARLFDVASMTVSTPRSPRGAAARPSPRSSGPAGRRRRDSPP